MVVLSLEVDLVFLPELEDQLYAFLCLVDPCLRVVPCAVVFEFCLGPSSPYASDGASGGQHVHGGYHLGQHCWWTEWDRGDYCSKLDLLGLGREIREGDPALHGRIFLWLSKSLGPHVMVRDHRPPESKLVRQLNCLFSQAPAVIPVSKTGKNEPQDSTPHGVDSSRYLFQPNRSIFCHK